MFKFCIGVENQFNMSVYAKHVHIHSNGCKFLPSVMMYFEIKVNIFG